MSKFNVHLIACLPGQQLTVIIKNFFLGYQSTPNRTLCVSCAAGFYCPDARFVNYFFFATRVTNFISAQKTESWGLRLFENKSIFCSRWYWSIRNELLHSKYDPVLYYAYWKFFTPQFFVNHPVYAITVIFICLLSDKASNAEFFQIFPCELYHTYSTFHLLSLKTKRTIAYSNPTASCLSLWLKSTGNNLGETEVFNAVRHGFYEVKLQIKTAVWPRQNCGKWFHSFRRYCSIWTNRKYFLLFSNPPIPCPTGMFSLGGRFENCTACPAGSACPDPTGKPEPCTGGNKLCSNRVKCNLT